MIVQHIFVSLICFRDYDRFLIMQLNLTCTSFQRTIKDISKEEHEALRFRDSVEKERDSEEDK